MKQIIENSGYKYLFAIFILIGFQINYGLGIVLPSSTNWIMSAYQDWGQHYLGWAYFREEAWTFPLGKIEHFNYPAGTTVGYTDSIPLLAIFFKAFSFLLPETFQYLGIWLLICHFFTGFFTLKILKLFKASNTIALIGALLIAFNPVILYRGMHPALCSHWLIIASIYYYLIKVNESNFKDILKKQLLLVALAALITPYLLFIVFVFTMALLAKYYFNKKIISIKQFSLYILSTISIVLFLWFITGMISFKNEVNMEVKNSYGLYSFNLNSFYNPETFSNILPPQLKVSVQQYEGFSYLGLGLILIIIIAVFLTLIKLKGFKAKNIYKWWPLIGIVLFFTLFAVTNTVSFGENVLFTYWLPETFIKIGGVFRASGRFIWVLYYIMILFSFVIIIRSSWSNLFKTIFFGLIAILQICDISQMLQPRHLPKGEYQNSKLSESKWVDITSNFKRIITYTPFNNHLLYTSDYQDLCFMALKNKLPITCGYVARESTEINRVFLDSLNLKLTEGEILNKDIYVTTPANLDFFNSLMYKDKVEVRYLDGYYILYSKKAIIKKRIENSEIEQFKIDSVYKKIKSDLKLTEIKKPVLKTDFINYNVEKSVFNNNILQLQGWAFLKNNHSLNDTLFIALVNDKKTYILKTKINLRPDLIDHFKDKTVENAGFSVNCFTKFVDFGKYELAIGIKDKNNEIHFQSLNQPIVEIKEDVLPKIRTSLPKQDDKIMGNVEKVNLSNTSYYIDGWGALTDQDSNDNKTYLILKGNNCIYEIETSVILRKDVTSHYLEQTGKNYDNAGFSALIKLKDLKKGSYKVGILIIDKNKKEYYFNSDKSIQVK